MAGLDVAVKTIRPGTTQRLRADLAILELATSALSIFTPRSAVPIAQVVSEVCESVRLQTNLQHEAASLARLAALESVVPVLVPKVLHSHCAADRLVMTWLPGQAEGRDFADPRKTAKHLLLAVYEMLFNTGIVHCDLHPGNWWELPDGRLAIVDAGFAYDLNEDMRVHFAGFFIGMATGNADVCTAHALAACAQPIRPHYVVGFRADMQVLIDTTRGKTAGSFSLAGFAARFFAIQRRHHAYSKAAFIFPFMALLAIEGQLKQLDPHVDFQSLAGPIALRAVAAHAGTRIEQQARSRPYLADDNIRDASKGR
jgi:ubiquinone biosynthesis protein